MRKSLLLGLILSLTLLGCSSQDSEKSSAPIDEFQVQDTELLENLALSPLGTGRFIFTTPLLSLDSKEHYLLEFRLLEEDSSIRLHSHFSSFQAADGFEINITRENSEILIKTSSPGLPETELIRIPVNSFKVSQRLRFEVHNGVAQGVRCLIWNDKISYDGLTWTSLDKVTRERALIDTRELSAIFLSKGQGIFWGLELQKAELIKSQREASYVD